jgi:hypothetical protein
MANRKQRRRVEPKPAVRPPPPRGSTRRLAAVLGTLLLAAYLGNDDTLANNDAAANVYLPLQLLAHGRLTFTVQDSPQLFSFRMRGAQGPKDVHFHAWDFVLDGKTMLEHYRAGTLEAVGPLYCLARTRRPGVYANTFGLGAGLLALPAVAVTKLFDPALQRHPPRLWQVGKLVAAAAVAGSAVFLFLAAAPTLGRRSAFLLALLYGLGTCVWSTSSQALFQHGPTELFLAMGCYFLIRPERPSPTLAGVALSAAVACRPTMVLVLAAIALVYLVRDRPGLLRLLLGALPVGTLLVLYGFVVFGHPLAAGQLGVGPEVATAKTGSPALWQTPLYLGTLGLLCSPARGLLVYSPLAGFGLWGLVSVWRDPKQKGLQALALAFVALFVLAAKWFDWWGGWCYGYRPIVDGAILLAFLAVPVVPWIRARRSRLLLCAVLGCWSFGVQALGAYAYDVTGWNGRWAYDVHGPGPNQVTSYDDELTAVRHAREHGGTVRAREQSVDRPAYRWRLWSIRDNALSFYLSRLERSRARRQEGIDSIVKDGLL